MCTQHLKMIDHQLERRISQNFAVISVGVVVEGYRLLTTRQEVEVVAEEEEDHRRRQEEVAGQHLLPRRLEPACSRT